MSIIILYLLKIRGKSILLNLKILQQNGALHCLSASLVLFYIKTRQCNRPICELINSFQSIVPTQNS